MTRRDDLLERLAQLNPVPDPSRLYEDLERSGQERLAHEKRRYETMTGIRTDRPDTGRRGPRNRRGLLIGTTAATLVIVVGLAFAFMLVGDTDVVGGGTPVLRLTFDGEECRYEGPATLSPGPVEFEGHNLSAGHAWMDFARLDQDRTVADVRAWQAADRTGSPPWAQGLISSPTLSAGSSYTADVVLEPGLHVLVCGTWTPYEGYFGASVPVE